VLNEITSLSMTAFFPADEFNAVPPNTTMLSFHIWALAPALAVNTLLPDNPVVYRLDVKVLQAVQHG
jgi:hypothetical protein